MIQFFRRHALLTVLGGAALAATLASPAHAAPPEGGNGRLERFCQEAKCTDSQKQDLRDVMREFHTDTKSDREKMKGLHKKLAAEFVKDNPNEKLMQRLYAQIDQIHGSMVDRRHDMMMEVHGLLDAGQRKIAAERLLEGPGKHGKGPKRGKGKARKQK